MENPSAAKRKRSCNYTLEDSFKLIEIVSNFKTIVENKRTDSVTSHDKANVWDKIASVYSSQKTEPRTADQLRQKYDSLKKETKYAANRRQQILQTGGGPPPHIKTNKLYEKISELIKLSSEGNKSFFDSDSCRPVICNLQVMEDIASDAGIPGTSDGFLSVLCIEPLVGFEEGTYQNGDGSLPESSRGLWSKYTPSMLRSPLHPLLQAHVSEHLEKESENDNMECSPGQHNKRPNVTDTNGVSSDDLDSFTENSIQTPTLQPHTTSLQRCRPILRKKNLSSSASGQKLEPWIKAKTQLTEESLLHLKKKNEREEKNEQEIHNLKIKEAEIRLEYWRVKAEEQMERKERREAEQRWEEELHKLRKEEILLSIKIKEEILKKLKNS